MKYYFKLTMPGSWEQYYTIDDEEQTAYCIKSSLSFEQTFVDGSDKYSDLNCWSVLINSRKCNPNWLFLMMTPGECFAEVL